MGLSRLEIQQMLREMNVKFHADESYESLKQRLQEENHRLWLESVSGHGSANGGPARPMVRKRKKKADSEDRPVDAAGPTAPAKPTEEHPVAASVPDRRRSGSSGYRPLPIEKPAPGQPWKAAADGTEPFNRKKHVFDSVLQRAKHRCERCGGGPAEPAQDGPLTPFHILPLAHGGEHSTKNVVALCSSCRLVMESDPSAKDLKDLKRKTRSRLYDSPQVERKTRPRQRRSLPFRGK